jgi:hypothetical protein
MALFYDIQFNEYEKSYLSFKMKSNNISSNNNSNDKFYSFEVIKPECDKNIIDKEILKEKYKKKMNELNKKRVLIR